MRYEQRMPNCVNPIAKKLFEIILEKKSNLSVAADVISKQALIDLVHQVGPHICLLKTHIDIVEDFDADLTEQLTALAQQYNFLIFEDRKFADIGNTVKLQFSKGIYQISNWAHIINAHIVPGPGIIDGLKEASNGGGHGLLLLAEMSSAGTLAKGNYTAMALEMAESYPEFVVGFISRGKLVGESHLLHMTPGVSLDVADDALGQKYLTPKQVVTENGSDIIIVGRSITGAIDPQAEAKRYQEAGWQAYLNAVAEAESA